MKIILGLVGEIAAGKTTITNYLKKHHHAVSFKFSDMLRDILDRVYVEKTRGNLQELSTFLRSTYSEDLMSQVIAKDVAGAKEEFLIVEGIRRPTDVTYLKDVPGFHLIAIEADAKLRFKRLTSRSENPDDQSKTWEQFQKDARAESEQKIAEIAAQAEFTINNNGSLQETIDQVEAIVKNIT